MWVSVIPLVFRPCYVLPGATYCRRVCRPPTQLTPCASGSCNQTFTYDRRPEGAPTETVGDKKKNTKKLTWSVFSVVVCFLFSSSRYTFSRVLCHNDLVFFNSAYDVVKRDPLPQQNNGQRRKQSGRRPFRHRAPEGPKEGAGPRGVLACVHQSPAAF